MVVKAELWTAYDKLYIYKIGIPTRLALLLFRQWLPTKIIPYSLSTKVGHWGWYLSKVLYSNNLGTNMYFQQGANDSFCIFLSESVMVSSVA